MAPDADFVDIRDHACVESEIGKERSPCGPLVRVARHRVIRCSRCPRDFQQVPASPNDTPRYLRCTTHPHYTTQTNTRPIRRSIQSLSRYIPTRRDCSLIQTWCAPSLCKFLDSFCATQKTWCVFSTSAAADREAVVPCRCGEVVV
jgi:hypothetical protein